MDDLTFTLRQLCLRNRDGSHAAQADRQRSLSLAACQLREAGFRQMRSTSLKGKHVETLLQRWQGEGLSAGTLKNRLAHLRWWAEKVGKAGSCLRTTPGWASVTTLEQRAALDEAHQLAGSGSLIPAHKDLHPAAACLRRPVQGRGVSNMHGLRHRYAQMRYEALAGWKAPAAAGPPTVALTHKQLAHDSDARQRISRELGHERIQITAVYL
jgi:hypothetical protein